MKHSDLKDIKFFASRSEIKQLKIEGYKMIKPSGIGILIWVARVTNEDQFLKTLNRVTNATDRAVEIN